MKLEGTITKKKVVIIDEDVTGIKITRTTPGIIEVYYDNKKYEADPRHLILRPKKGTMLLG